MPNFYLVSEVGEEIIKQTSLSNEVWQSILEAHPPKSKMIGIIFEVFENEVSILNGAQCKELLFDFCRADLLAHGCKELFNLMSMMVECYDGIHLKLIIEL